MSHESRIMSFEERAGVLARDFCYPNYRTVDFDDAFDEALNRTTEVLGELESVEVSKQLKDQAAFCVGQYFLDGLKTLAREQVADYFASTSTISNTRPYIVLSRAAHSGGRNG